MFRLDLPNKSFAVKFNRNDDRTTTCTLRDSTGVDAADIQDPVKWPIVGIGVTKRNPRDPFDKGVGQVQALHRAMNEAGLPGIGTPRIERKAIAEAHREWLIENGVRTHLLDRYM